jgi:hypothetical protein
MDACVAVDRTAAIRDPSGDHVGNPWAPLLASASTAAWPSARTTASDPSGPRTAIDPDEAIGTAAGSGLGGIALVAAAEKSGVGTDDGGWLGEGAGPPHPAATTIMSPARTPSGRAGRRRIAIA